MPSGSAVTSQPSMLQTWYHQEYCAEPVLAVVPANPLHWVVQVPLVCPAPGQHNPEHLAPLNTCHLGVHSMVHPVHIFHHPAQYMLGKSCPIWPPAFYTLWPPGCCFHTATWWLPWMHVWFLSWWSTVPLTVAVQLPSWPVVLFGVGLCQGQCQCQWHPWF